MSILKDIINKFVSLGGYRLAPNNAPQVDFENFRNLAAAYEGHPHIHVPKVVDQLSARRVLTSELVDGVPVALVPVWSQHARSLAGETGYRFMMGSL